MRACAPGCGICVMTCPYEAPHLIEKEVDGVMDRFSEVDANKCMGCGMCVAACPMGAIARPGVSNPEVVSQIEIKKKRGETIAGRIYLRLVPARRR